MNLSVYIFQSICILLHVLGGQKVGISGSSYNAMKFLGKLDPQKLVDLTCDMLFRQGHSNIKAVDGPGDGCRDIHSVNKTGETQLTQCKFHKDIAKTVSSKEIGELPLGMIKLGYKNGLFITNAKISPQAKREFLNDYRNLNLDFMEGAKITEIVFSDIILKSIWYDGVSIDKVSYIIVVPVVARDLIKDKPLPIISNHDLEKLDLITFNLDVEGTMLQLKLRLNNISSSAFDPYRPPKIKTISEFWSPQLNATEVLLTGTTLLNQLESSISAIKSILLSELKKKINKERNHIAIRIGRPYISLLGGEAVGERIELFFASRTIVLQDCIESIELDWVLPSPNSGWLPPPSFRVSQANWVRWYNRRLDVCLDINILSPPDESWKRIMEEHREFIMKWWKKSVFAVVPKSIVSFDKSSLQSPTYTEDWSNNEVLCAWLHGNLETMLRPALIEPEEGANSEKFSWDVDVQEAERVLKKIAEDVVQLGGKILDPDIARHMFAIVKGDPYPDIEKIWYRSVDLLENSDVIPSPIDPKSRYLEFTVCYCLDKQSYSKNNLEEIILRVDEIIINGHPDFVSSSYFDTDTIWKNYLVLKLSMKNDVGYERTADIIQKREISLELALNDIEEKLRNYIPNLVRATKEYWKMEIGIIFE